MPIIQIEQNNSLTLERARFQIRSIASAKDTQAVYFQWTWAAGYFVALVQEKLIDEDTKRELDSEADKARDEWKPAKPPSQLPEGGGFQQTVSPPPRVDATE